MKSPTLRPQSAIQPANRQVKKKSGKKKSGKVNKQSENEMKTSELDDNTTIIEENDESSALEEEEELERPKSADMINNTQIDSSSESTIDNEEVAEPLIPDTRINSKGVKVMCRVRPLLEFERKKTNQSKCLKVVSNKELYYYRGEASDGEPSLSFPFSHVFDEDATQEALFNQIGKPAASHLIEGYNTSIIAYGQTGSGKTYTMQGDGYSNSQGNWICDDPSRNGLIPRTLTYLFDRIQETSTVRTTVKASFLEIYMEKVNDLITGVDRLSVTGKGDLFVNATQVLVSSPREVLRVMAKGLKSRKVASHDANAQSSRSHSIFVLTIERRDVVNASIKKSQLYLVDLAGSEEVKKTNVSGATLREASNINTSLLALRKVIFALSDKKIQKKLKKNPNFYFGYRDSILTRLLKNSLGGNAQCSIIVNVSPSKYNAAESLSTLRFGQRSAKMRNKPRINEKPSVEELQKKLASAHEDLNLQKSLVKTLNAEIFRLRKEKHLPAASFVQDEPDRLGSIDSRLFYSFFICPLTRKSFIDPVVAMDGHTYEKKALIQFFKSQRSACSPLNGRPIHSTLMIPNMSLRSQMTFFQDQFGDIYNNVDYSFYWRPGDAIPEDIVKLILEYLQPQEIVIAGAVNTMWHRCSRSPRIWRKIYESHIEKSENDDVLEKYDGDYFQSYWHYCSVKQFGSISTTNSNASSLYLYQ